MSGKEIPQFDDNTENYCISYNHYFLQTHQEPFVTTHTSIFKEDSWINCLFPSSWSLSPRLSLLYSCSFVYREKNTERKGDTLYTLQDLVNFCIS